MQLLSLFNPCLLSLNLIENRMTLKHPAAQCKFPRIVKRMRTLTCEALTVDFRGLENTVCSKQKSVNKQTKLTQSSCLDCVCNRALFVFLWASFRWKCDSTDQSSMRIHSNTNKQLKCTRASKKTRLMF